MEKYNRYKTVTNGNWCVSSTSGDGIQGAILHVFQFHGLKMRRASCYGMQFETTDAAHKFAYDNGYLQTYYNRTWCLEHRTLHEFCGKPSGVQGKCWHVLPDENNA